jgi:hypothetical protein
MDAVKERSEVDTPKNSSQAQLCFMPVSKTRMEEHSDRLVEALFMYS